MTERNGSAGDGREPLEQANEFGRMAAQSQRIVADFIARQQKQGALEPHGPFDVGEAFIKMTQQMLSDPARLVQAQMGLWEGYVKLWQHTANRMKIGRASCRERV